MFPYHRGAKLAQREQGREIEEQLHIIIDVSPSLVLIPDPPKPKKSEIKKQLKIIVYQSNILQDENNKLKDMKDQWVPFKEIFAQRIHIGKLCQEQYTAIEVLKKIESFYPKEKHNRFYYFKDVPISFP